MLFGQSFSNAAEGLGLYADVGCNVVLRNALADVGKRSQEGAIAHLGRIGIQRVDLLDGRDKHLADGQPPESLAVADLRIEHFYVGFANAINRRIFQGLDIDQGRLLRQEAGVVANKLPFFIKIIGFLFAVYAGVIPHQPCIDEKDGLADIACLQ